MTEFALQIWALSRWLTKGHISPCFKFKFCRLTQAFSSAAPFPVAFGLQRATVPAPSAQSETTWTCQHIKQQLRSAAAAVGPCFGACWTRLRGIVLLHPVVCPLAARNLSHSLHIRLLPPRGPGTGRGRLTNCKGFNWAAHKLFTLHKGIGSSKCHKPIMR